MSDETFRQFRTIHARFGDLISEALSLQGTTEGAYTAATVLLRDGYPTGQADGPSGNSVSNPTLAAVLDRERILESRTTTDPKTRQRVVVDTGVRAINTSLNVAAAALREAREELHRIIRPAIESDHTIGILPGAGYCRACRRWVPGGVTDRIVTGFCPKDYKRWQRADRPDIIPFIREVQLELGIIGPDDNPVITPEPDER